MLLDDWATPMPLGSWIHANLIYRTAVTLRGEGNVFRCLKEFERLQYRAPDEIRNAQEGQLSSILLYANNRSPYYQKRWDGLVSEVDLLEQPRASLRRLPFVTKADLQDCLGELVAIPAVRPVTRKTTGGSTGQAVTVLKDRAATGREMAASWLGYGWFGVRIGDKQARFWGQPHTVRRRIRAYATRIAVRRISFSAFAFDDRDLERYWERCLRERPTYFYGYVSMLEAFASFVLRRGLDGRQLGLKAIVTTSEVLGEPQRRLLVEAFGAPVQNEYGCGEVGAIAYECEQGRLHVVSDNLLVEVVNDTGQEVMPGETGHVVVTDLNNRAMPLIRYRVGDLAVPGLPCVCGRGFPTLERVWGREYDFVQDANGKRYHGEFIMYVFEDLRDNGVPVQQFQIVQRRINALEALVVTGASDPQQVVAAVVDELQTRMPGVVVEGRHVRGIERAPSGKLRLIRNELSALPSHAVLGSDRAS